MKAVQAANECAMRTTTITTAIITTVTSMKMKLFNNKDTEIIVRVV